MNFPAKFNTHSNLTKHRLRTELNNLRSSQSVSNVIVQEDGSWRVVLSPRSQPQKSSSFSIISAPDSLELSPNKRKYADSEASQGFVLSPSDAAWCDTMYENFDDVGAAYACERQDSNDGLSFLGKTSLEKTTPPRHTNVAKSAKIAFFLRFPEDYPFSPPRISVEEFDALDFFSCDLLHWTPACTANDIVRAVTQYVASN